MKILHQVFAIFFKNEYTDQNTVQLQFLHNLHLTSWSVQPLPPVLEHPGSYQQKILEMEEKKKSSSVPGTVLSINSESTLNRNVTGLDKYTEYEFQVLAFTSTGDGPKSSVVVKRTKEDGKCFHLLSNKRLDMCSEQLLREY